MNDVQGTQLMAKGSIAGVGRGNPLETGGGFLCRGRLVALAALGFVLLTAVVGCQTPQVPQQAWERSEDVYLREGDVVKITFPGAPNLDATQQIRRDGKISLAMLGEITAAGLTPAELEKMLLELYSTQLVSKEVVVSIVSSSFSVFVTGAVLRPGKITSDRPISVLEAIMEAGGPVYTKANLKSVAVIREEEGHVDHYRLNVKVMLEGKQSRPFYLKPSDIIYVPERFSWF